MSFSKICGSSDSNSPQPVGRADRSQTLPQWERVRTRLSGLHLPEILYRRQELGHTNLQKEDSQTEETFREVFVLYVQEG